MRRREGVESVQGLLEEGEDNGTGCGIMRLKCSPPSTYSPMRVDAYMLRFAQMRETDRRAVTPAQK